MGMLVKILKLTSPSAAALEEEINSASRALKEEGRYVVEVSFVPGLESGDGMPIAMLKHMPDESVDYMKKAIDAQNALERIVDGIRPDTDPHPEEYDDTQSAYANGMDVAHWDLAKDLDAVLARLRA
jgi:hypothetical protein